MELYLLRHAIAAPLAPAYKDDSLRPLTPEGRRKMACAARGMQALGLRFDCVVSSPYLRARQTAEIVARVYKLKGEIHLTENLLPPAAIKTLLQEIKTLFPKSEGILLVGHQPHLTDMVSCLLKSDKPLNIDLKKGGLCYVSVNPPAGGGRATLNWIMTSKQLGRIK